MKKNIFAELYKKYTSKLISKAKFVDLSYKNHQILFDYADHIKSTDIKSISIEGSEVKMTSRRNEIIMLCRPSDKRIAPIEILNFKNYEGSYFDIFLALTKEVKIVFDIGANIGWHSLNVAKLNKKAKVYAFEPIKESYNYLVKNIKLNNLTNIIPNNFGFSDKNRTVKFYVNPELFTSASEKKISNLNTLMIKVILKKLDDYCLDNNISKIDIIKCDVEGAELFVLKGGKKILEKYKPILFVEMLRKWAKKYNYHPNDIIDFMNTYDYLCFTIDTGGLKRIIRVNEDTKATNYIFFHRVIHSNLIKKI